MAAPSFESINGSLGLDLPDDFLNELNSLKIRKPASKDNSSSDSHYKVEELNPFKEEREGLPIFEAREKFIKVYNISQKLLNMKFSHFV